ncbi:tRNA methyltransferase [Paraconexibacter sp. AEG42_29]|uniref:tRNA methyltransferase n=1 Tax=Paraconexibacter sp. AEG42_29 TaxID=2997339 RepID=A0AAU7AXK1_9ACTN
MSTIDWSIGSYERTATELDPASAEVVELAGITAGERVLDIACGTGNAALKAAARGGIVVGVDLAERLVLVAQQRAQAAGLDVKFVPADAQQLPLDDGTVDVALSVFGLIFAPDQQRTAAEMVRVLRPGGRAIVTGWVRAGALADVGAATARARAAAAPQQDTDVPPAGRTVVDWGDRDTVAELFAPHPVTLEFADSSLPFRAASPDAWVREQAEHHPLWLGTRELLGDERFVTLERELIDILHAANEDPQGLLMTSRYLITTITRDETT